MREDDMLRLSLECARRAVRGEDYAEELAQGVCRVLGGDPEVGITVVNVAPIGELEVQVTLADGPPYPMEFNREAIKRIARHPIL